jgi:hypothetical protein
MSHAGLPLDWYQAQMGFQSSGGGKYIASRPELPNTRAFTESQLYDTYAKFVLEHGTREAKQALVAGDQVIVGLRVTTNTRANHGLGVYDDKIAVIWTETPKKPVAPVGPRLLQTTFGSAASSPAATIKHGADFTANTEPSAQYEDQGKVWKVIKSPKTGKITKVQVADKIIGPDGQPVMFRKLEGKDVRHDGRQALGELVPGTYRFHFGESETLGVVLRGTDDQVVRRDVNHDGFFTADDVWHTDQGDTVVETGYFAILIHKGSLHNTGSGGCQTLPDPEFRRFYAGLNKKQTSFYYVLVTVR